MATQLHLRAAMPAGVLEAWVGLVVSSSERMACSRSVRAVEAPCMGVPPAMEILVVVFLAPGPGVDDLELGLEFGLDLDLGTGSRSETKVPAALDCGFGCVCCCDGGFDGPWSWCGVEAPDLPDM